MVKLTKYCTSSTLLMVKRFWASNGVSGYRKITQVSLLQMYKIKAQIIVTPYRGVLVIINILEK